MKEYLFFRPLTLMILTLFGFSISKGSLFAQEQLFFVNKPDEGIKRIIEYGVNSQSDTTKGFVYDYNQHGQLIKVEDPGSYIFIGYKYDDKGRIFEKEEFYGESFSNGMTTYFYSKGKETEITRTIGLYNETRKEIDEKGNISTVITFSVSGGMGNSLVERRTFKYNKDSLLEREEIDVKFYDLEKEPGGFLEIESKEIIDELLNSEFTKKQQFVLFYSYNVKKQLIKTQFKELITGKVISEIEYIYNQEGLLTEEINRIVDATVQYSGISSVPKHIKKVYDENNRLKTVIETGDYLQLTKNYENGRLVNFFQKSKTGNSYKTFLKYIYYNE